MLATVYVGCGDMEYFIVFVAIVLPILVEWNPDTIFVAAGFDAHKDDPLGSFKVSRSKYGHCFLV